MYARFKVHAVDQLDIKILKKYCIPDVYDLFILEQSLQAEFRTQCTDPRDFNDMSHLLDKLHLTFVFSCISQYFVIKWGHSSPRLMSFKWPQTCKCVFYRVTPAKRPSRPQTKTKLVQPSRYLLFHLARNKSIAAILRRKLAAFCLCQQALGVKVILAPWSNITCYYYTLWVTVSK